MSPSRRIDWKGFSRKLRLGAGAFEDFHGRPRLAAAHDALLDNYLRAFDPRALPGHRPACAGSTAQFAITGELVTLPDRHPALMKRPAGR